MPNGGPDCCGNCSHNCAVQEMAHPHPSQRDRFEQLSRCTLRQVPIPNPFWTYCANFAYGKHPEHRNQSEVPKGWIYSSGMYEGYVRIPWDGPNEPRVGEGGLCVVCGRVTSEGIELARDGHSLVFCTNRHYLEWWKSIHNDPSIDPSAYETPESRYGCSG